jgi:hypothetical protein
LGILLCRESHPGESRERRALNRAAMAASAMQALLPSLAFFSAVFRESAKWRNTDFCT